MFIQTFISTSQHNHIRLLASWTSHSCWVTHPVSPDASVALQTQTAAHHQHLASDYLSLMSEVTLSSIEPCCTFGPLSPEQPWTPWGPLGPGRPRSPWNTETEWVQQEPLLLPHWCLTAIRFCTVLTWSESLARLAGHSWSRWWIRIRSTVLIWLILWFLTKYLQN